MEVKDFHLKKNTWKKIILDTMRDDFATDKTNKV